MFCRDRSAILLASVAVLSLLIRPLAVLGQVGEIEYTRLDDGVELWERKPPTDQKPWFFKQVERVYSVFIPSKTDLPFENSVAFLVGVGEYEHLPPLQFVQNDIEGLRVFLLEQAGFDRVFVARDQVVTPGLVNEYMKNIFRTTLGKRDRLLFYYAGHGADLGGTTGYMQFANAKPDNYVDGVVAIKDCRDWSRFNDVAHALFIFDCCASGMAFQDRSGGDEDNYSSLLRTLSGNGSRAIITAGKSNENSYEIETPEGGHGVFTLALLAALNSDYEGGGIRGLATIDQVFVDTKIRVSVYGKEYEKNLSPRIWLIDEDRYDGSFVFVTPKLQDVGMQQEVCKSLNIYPRCGAGCDAYGNRARVELEDGNYQIAIEQLNQAIGECPDDPLSFAARGRAYHELNMLEDAARDYRLALQKNPRLPETLSNLGRIHFVRGEFKEAIKLVEEAHELRPGSQSTLYLLGYSYLSEGLPEKAEEALTAAIGIGPEAADVYYLRGLARERIKKSAEAIEDFKKVRILAPGSKYEEQANLRLNALRGSDDK